MSFPLRHLGPLEILSIMWSQGKVKGEMSNSVYQHLRGPFKVEDFVSKGSKAVLKVVDLFAWTNQLFL